MRRRRDEEKEARRGKRISELRASLKRLEEVLNPEQMRAVEALQKESLQKDYFFLSVVDGPPGTGKTTTGAAAIVRKLIEREEKVKYLVLCYTHAACLRFKEALERWGLRPSEAVYLKPSLGAPSGVEYQRGIVSCDPYLRDLEAGVVSWLKQRYVLITTLLGVTRAIRALANQRIHLMIDEFSQVSGADFFTCVNQTKNNMPYQYSLLGDPYQLPVVTSQSHLRPNICILLNPTQRGANPVRLHRQYRMHEHICSAVNKMRKVFPSAHELVTEGDARGRTLTKMGYSWNPPLDSWMKKVLDPENPIVLIDTSPLGYEDSVGEKVFFKKEAELAARIAREASKCFQVGKERLFPQILTPYNAQRDLIASFLIPEKWPEKREPMTIYKAQGAEYPMVILSFVRSNPNQRIGFLSESMLHEQAYVGVSRAQAKIVVLLSKQTFVDGGHAIFRNLWDTPEAVKEEAKAE